MRIASTFFCLMMVLVFAPQATAQVLTTDNNNNGFNGDGAGVYFDLTDLTGTGLRIDSFETSVFASTGDFVTAELWVRDGSYVGNIDSDAGWTLLGSVGGVASADTNGSFGFLTEFDTPDHDIAAGATNGFALLTDFGIAYQGVGGTATTDFNDGNLAFFGDTAFTGVFGTGVNLTPRVFSGSITYAQISQVPEPGSAAVVLLGLAGMIVRRNRR